MNVESAVSVPIPAFPFANRNWEWAELTKFLDDADMHASVFLIEGEAGVGKSSLLLKVCEQALDNGDNLIVITAQTKHENGLPLFEQIEEQISSRQTRSIRYAASVFSPVRLASETILPKIARGVPFAGHALEALAAQELKRHAGKGSQILKMLKGEKKVLLVVDDLHSMTFDEVELTIDLLSATRSQFGPFKSLISNRIDEDIPVEIQKLVRSYIKQVSNDGLMRSIRLRPLADEDIQSIIASVISKPSHAANLIAGCLGNPQRLRENLIRLNLQGELRSEHGLLVLPTTKNVHAISEKGFVSSLEISEKLLNVALAASIGPRYLDCSILMDIAKRIAGSDNSPETIIFSIVDAEVLTPVKKDVPFEQNIFRFSHDLMRESFSNYLCSNAAKWTWFNSLMASILTEYLGSEYPRYHSEFVAAGTFETNPSPIPEPVIQKLLQVAKNSHEGSESNRQALCISSLRHCERLGLFSEACAFGELLLPWIDQTLDQNSPTAVAIKKILVKSYYSVGRYADAVALASGLSDLNGVAYTRIASLYMVRAREAVLVELEKTMDRREDNGLSQEELVRLKGFQALILQEMGEDDAAGDLYQHALTSVRKTASTSADYEYLTMSPLFSPATEARQICSDAITFFHRKGEDRRLGTALTNRGFSNLLLHQYPQALDDFFTARELLLSVTSHEAFFPINGLGFIYLVQRQFEEAISFLESALFFRLSANYEANIRTNLELARFHTHGSANISILEKLATEPGVASDPWTSWIITYNCAYFFLMENRSSLTPMDITLWRNRILELKCASDATPFWNALVDNLLEPEEGLKWHMRLPENPTNPFSGLASPEMNLFRPTAFCFGHW